MARFKKIPINAIHWGDSDLQSFINEDANWHDRPRNLELLGDCVYIEERFLTGNLRSQIHRAFLFLSPLYRRINGYPHFIAKGAEKLWSKYD